MPRSAHPNDNKQHESRAQSDTGRGKKQKLTKMELVADVFLTIIFVAALGLALVDYQSGRTPRVVVWGTIAWVAASIGIAVKIYQRVDSAPVSVVDPQLELTRGRISLRLRLGEPITIGKPIKFVAELENTGSADAKVSIFSDVRTWPDLPDGDAPDQTFRDTTIYAPKTVGIHTVFDGSVVTAESIAQIRQGTMRPYFFGHITYTTMGREYREDFCVFPIAIDTSQFSGLDATDPHFALRRGSKWFGNWEDGSAAKPTNEAILAGGLPEAVKSGSEPGTKRTPAVDPITEVRDLLTKQSSAQVRPYMVIAHAEMLWPLKVGENVVVSVWVRNDGKTPASNVRAFGRLDYQPVSARVNRKYDAFQPQDGVGETVAVEQRIILDVVSDRLTEEQFKNITSGAYNLIAHGRVRYEAPTIEGGRDDLLFCLYYDTLAKRMSICDHRIAADYDPPREQRKQ